MSSAEVRRKIVDALLLDLVGPIADPARESERLIESPSRWYLTGFLVPSDRPTSDLHKPAEEEDRDEESDDLFASDDDPVEDVTAEAVHGDDSDKGAAPAPTRRQLLPSSLGLSLLVPRGTTRLDVTVRWGDYTPEFAPEPAASATPAPAAPSIPERPLFTRVGESALGPGPRAKARPTIVSWGRRQREATCRLDLSGEFLRPRWLPIPDSDGLQLEYLCRPAPAAALDAQLVPDGAMTVNVYLVNRRDSVHGRLKDQGMAFQAELTARIATRFIPRPNLRGLHTGEDFDERQADLQYRDVCEFAVGHNTSAHAVVDAGCDCREVRTAWVPHALVERVNPRPLDGITLGMEALAKLETPAEAAAALVGLADQYEAWLVEQRRVVDALPQPRRVEYGSLLLDEAKLVARRIRAGIAELADPKALRAFTLANAAMAAQARRRVAIPRGLRPEDVPEPTWYPFQLAFFLLNLRGIIHPDEPDRRTVDLLFFPTGGGKTEAYLGLAAFTLLYRRFREGVTGPIPRYAGVTVLMRYTLRLLTLDQLGRAAALVCALEVMRRADPDTLGKWPFEIGLWVGSGATPNYMGKKGDEHGVVAKVINYKIGKDTRPPVPLEACPWCQRRLGPDSFHLRPSPDRAELLEVACTGDDCDFHGDHPLPIHMVDEPIYDRLPGFLIATVDKFAAMPWKGEVAKLFGRVKSFTPRIGFHGDSDDTAGIDVEDRLPPPEFIIQDELHLISGPLGTVTGLYESAIHGLCRDHADQGPKIVSSTATVRRANQQILALFGRDSVQVFPPPGPDRRDSFFARAVSSPDEARQYLGVAAQGRSAKRVLLKTYLALMSAVQKLYLNHGAAKSADNPVDPYMTLLGYFNSLRELGGTRRLVEDELTSRLSQYGKRRRIGDADSPFADRPIRSDALELTSRFSTSQVSEAKDKLGRPFDTSGGVDVALATNMISVGLDIPRLGLMAVFAQPKMTSEYIQATSRVGRRAGKPGLIVTIFNINRPRDRSHYERFGFFHETFYRNVEATSVTPFSPRALDRALFAVAVSLARLDLDFMNRDEEAAKILEHGARLDVVARTIAERARVLHAPGSTDGPIESTPVYKQVRSLLDEWAKYAEDLKADKVSLSYTHENPPRSRALLREMLDPRLATNAQARQFKAPRSMRDVEPVVAILPRKFKAPKAPIKVGNEVAVASLRQGQLISTYGPGAMIDLPRLAAVVSGLDFWDRPADGSTRIVEPRLEAKAAQAIGGTGVVLASPHVAEKANDPTARGVVAWKFPKWSITQKTRRVSEGGRTYQTRLLVPEGQLNEKGQIETDTLDDRRKAEKLDVVPVRFVRACTSGHMSDIDWFSFAHRGANACNHMHLWLDDMGATGELNELRVRCECGVPPRYISEAAGENNPVLGRCNGAEPWLDPGLDRGECENNSRLLIRTASNAYFPQKLSVISMPDPGRGVHAAVAEAWDDLEIVEEAGDLKIARRKKAVAATLADFSDDQVMQAIEARRSGQEEAPPRKIKSAEFDLLTSGQPVIGKEEHDSVFFAEELTAVGPGSRRHPSLQRVLVVHRLREVTALVGYTRFDYISPDIDGEFDLDLKTSRLGLNLDWLPAGENKGEGLFLQFHKDQVEAWKERAAVREVAARMERGCENWGAERGLPPRQFFGAGYVMLHSLSHLLINAISLECGYPASSIKERIYANPKEGYGLLLYTAGADSYGTLGGLASAAKSIDHYLAAAIEMGRLCSNDPVCAQHHADSVYERRHLHGAACHGCLLIGETSCELLNDFLDRSLVVPTVDCPGAAFFGDDLS